MGTPFEDFVNLELPRRSTFLNSASTGYDGDPNDGGAPAMISGAPLGTWFREETAEKWWRKAETLWEEQGVGGSLGNALIFREGGGETGPVVFGNYFDLMDHLDILRLTGGSFEVLIDDSVTSPTTIPANPDTAPIALTAAFTGPVVGSGGLVDRMTLTDVGASFVDDDIGRWVTIVSATSPANDGTFLVTSVPSSTSVEYINASGVAEAQGVATYSLTVPHDMEFTPLVAVGRAEIDVADGTTFRRLREFRGNGFLTYQGTPGSPSPISDFQQGGSFDQLSSRDGFSLNTIAGSPALIDTSTADAGMSMNFWMTNSGMAIFDGPVIHIGLAGQGVNFFIEGIGSSLRANAVSSVVGATAIYITSPGSGSISPQTAVLGGEVTFVNNDGPWQNVSPAGNLSASTSPLSVFSATVGVLRLDVSSGGFTQPLPSLPAAGSFLHGGSIVTVKEESGTTGLLVDAAGANTIEGSTDPFPVPAGGTVVFVNDGDSNWIIQSIFDPGTITLFSNRLIFKPGVAEDTTVVFGTWTALIARLDQLKVGNGGGNYDVEVDDTLVSPAVIPVAAPTAGSPTAAFLFSTPTMSLTDGVASFPAAMIGRYVTIAGATTPANNGTFRVTGIPSATVVEYTNAAGVAEAQGSATYSITTPWDLTNVKLVGPIDFASVCNLADGATFLGLRHIISLRVESISASPSPPSVTDFGGHSTETLTIEDGATVNTLFDVPIWDTSFAPISQFLFIYIRGQSKMAQNPSGGSPVVHLGAAGQLMFFQASSMSGVWRNGLSAVVGTLLFAVFDTSATWGVQQNFLGTVVREDVQIEGPDGNVEPVPPASAHSSAESLAISNGWNRSNASGGGFTHTLPTISAIGGTRTAGRRMLLTEESGTVGLLVQRGGTDTLNGATTPVAIPAGGSIVLISDGESNWGIESVFDPSSQPSVDTALVSTTPNALSNGRVARYDSTAGNIVANLPAASSVLNGDVIYVSNEVGGNSVNVTPAGADTINSVAALLALITGTSKQFRSDGTSNWTSF